MMLLVLAIRVRVMPKEISQSFDVTVIGAGVAGLMLTKKLSELGLHTALIEKQPKLAGGPSTRNEGWLHRGTYHATSIKDRANAIQVAKRCIYGHEQIKRFAPEALEDIDLPSFALIRNPDSVDEAVSRWNEADVLYKCVLLRQLAELEPNVKTDNIAAAFQVNDVGINTRILYRKLLTAAENAGAQIFPGSELVFQKPEEAGIKRNGEVQPIESKLFVYTAGFGVRQLFDSNFNLSVPVRYWKSHLLVVPRLTKSSVFFIDPHEAGMMNHGDYSIVGLNEDAFQCDAPNYDCIEQGIQNIYEAMERFFYTIDDSKALPVACIKTDLAEKSAAARSLNISISEPIPNHICVLPGKMTESPYVTDYLTRMVYERINDDLIALRPMDTIK